MLNKKEFLVKAKAIFKDVYPTLAILCAILVVINFNFFYQQAKYYFSDSNNQKAQITTQPNLLQIPSLNVSAPVIYVSEKTEKVYQAALASGVVHYPETALPGELGNAYIFGHSSDLAWSKGSYKTVFALLPKIKIGDKIVISNQTGEQFTYIVTKTFVVSPSDLSVLDQFNKQKKVLTLQTSYPVGTALKRFIVQAEISPN